MKWEPIDDVVVLYLALEDEVGAAHGYEREFTQMGGRAWWERVVAAAWRHYGDCTGQPVTCEVCLVEQNRQEARGLLSVLHMDFHGAVLGNKNQTPPWTCPDGITL